MISFNPSYSVISMYAKGDVEGALYAYFHMDEYIQLPGIVEEAMEVGREWHKKFQTHIETYSTVPKELTDKEIRLIAPNVEERIYFPIDEERNIHFTCIPDCVVPDTLYDWKVGSTPASDWAGDFQLPLYAVACNYNHIYPTIGMIYRWNPKTNERDKAIVFLSAETKLAAEEWAKFWSVKMYKFMIKHDLFNNYQERRDVLRKNR